MSKILSPYFVSLVQDACLKSFWKKGALKNFLRQCKIREETLSRLDGESKSQFLSFLFGALVQNQDERHQKVILYIAECLTAMNSFPDLVGWEDSKAKIEAATEARDLLRKEFDKLKSVYIDTGDRDRRQAEKKRRDEIASHEARFGELVTRLLEIQKHTGEQDAGYLLETWIYDLLVFNDITARKPYKDPTGRQIDGAAEIDGTNYLIEVKCTSDPIAVTEIDSFRAKIQTKADNTLGLMFSMSGFQDGAIKGASCGRTPFVLLDGTHLFNLVIARRMQIKDVIRRIGRHAAQTGVPYLGVSEFLV